MGVRADFAGLVRAARAGDDQAYGVLVEACWDDLVRFARSIVGDLDAEDVVQESLVLAWRDLGGLHDADRFRAWVTTAVYRRALRWKRWSWWRRQRAIDQPRQPAATDPDAGLDVAKLLARLTKRQRAVMHLTVVDGMSDTEVARVLSMAPGTVRAHRRRAKAVLEDQVRRYRP